MFRFKLNAEWDEEIFESLFNDSIEKIRLIFPHMTDDQIKRLSRKQLTCLNTLIIGYKDGVPVMMTSGVSKDRHITFVSLLFGKINGSRDFIYSEEYLTAGFQFLRKYFDTFTQNEPVGSSICDYMDEVNSSKFLIYGDDEEEFVIVGEDSLFKKRKTVKSGL